MASYPNLVSVTPNEVYHVTSPLAATWSYDQTFSVDSTAGWFEADSTGAPTTVLLGQSGPFVLEVKAEKILCSEIKGNVVYVYQDNASNGRAYSSTSAVAHPLGDAVTLIATSAQNAPPVFGALITRKFPFAYNLAGLNTGVALYTPVNGEVLYDAWIGVKTAWDGTGPLGDINIANVGSFGNWFGAAYNNALYYDMAGADSANSGFGPLHNFSLAGMGAASGIRGVPIPLQAANPVGVQVSQAAGLLNGVSPGSTVGNAVLYLVLATPI